jgi:phospholipase C
VILIQENRSFDHYFGQMTAYRQANNIPINGSPATIDDLSTGNYANYSPATGGMIAAYHTGSVCTEDLTPDWTETHKDFNRQNPAAASNTAPMDGFVALAYAISQWAGTLGIEMADQTGRRVMGYFDGNDLNYYYFMASQFALDDHFYAPMPGNTPGNRMYLMAATSQGYVHDPPGNGTITAVPIFEELDAKGVSWKIYTAQSSLYTYLKYFSYYNQAGVAAHIVPLQQYFTDAKAGSLPAVSLIETDVFAADSEHTSNFDPAHPANGEVPINVQTGAAWAANIINALLVSPNWTDSVLFFAHDEGGGLFDHVPPISVPNPDGIKPVDLRSNDVPGDFTITGGRVPNMVISPFTKKNYVSHTPMDYTSYLRFIEARWGLATLTARDAAMPDMTEFFDFAAKPWATPPNPPVQSLNGACDFTKQ